MYPPHPPPVLYITPIVADRPPYPSSIVGAIALSVRPSAGRGAAVVKSDDASPFLGLS